MPIRRHSEHPPRLDMPEFGLPIPESARQAGVCALHDMMRNSTLSDGAARVLIDDVARHLEADKPALALLEARTVLDLTGAYRLVATLCSSELEARGLDIIQQGTPA